MFLINENTIVKDYQSQRKCDEEILKQTTAAICMPICSSSFHLSISNFLMCMEVLSASLTQS